MPGARDVVLSSQAEKVLARLERRTEPAAKSIAGRVRGYREILLRDCLHGEVVRKRAIPDILRKRHGVENLFVEDLPAFWRLLYTVVRDRGELYVVILEIVDHDTYVTWFRSRRR
ncbi:MAG: hypothetical protein HY557_01625 [Euryarchaeota archaeon]|nr:hypothetical protein [Euryarchaeota archaeon]